jgi:hypothetical protein
LFNNCIVSAAIAKFASNVVTFNSDIYCLT